MTNRLLRWISVSAGLCLSLLAATPSWAQGRVAYLLNSEGTQLFTIDTANPETAMAGVNVTGVTAGETLVNIDIRPSNGMLYGLGVNGLADTMTLYLLSPRTGVATAVGAGSFTGAGNLPLSSGFAALYGFDFNPVTDRIRVTTSDGAAGFGSPGLNFRINPSTGTLEQADNDINPVPPIRVHDVAFTNNGLASTVTTQYSIGANAIYIQNPANSGTQTQAVPLTPFGFTWVSGFDLDVDAVAPGNNLPVTAGSSEAYVLAAGAGAGPTALWRVNLLTGVRSVVGTNVKVANGIGLARGLAVQPTTVPGDLPAFALTANGLSLLRFSTSAPGTTIEAAITAGIVAGDVLSAIDIRPQTGQLYALGFNAVNNTVQLYLVDPWTNAGGTTASVTAVGAPVALTLPGATAFGFDFNPAADRVRVVTDAGENFRLNPNTGALAGTDTAINPAGAVTTAAAYTNNFGQSIIAAGPTTLYTLDAVNDRLAIQNAPNGGTQTEFHTITLLGSPLDFTSVSGFDIPSQVQTSTANAAATGLAYAVLTVGGTASLYAIELSTGVATFAGNVGTGAVPLSGLALGDGARVLTATAVTPSPNPAVLNQTVTLTATVTPAAASGTVDFSDGGAPIAGCTARPLTIGIATCQVAFTSVGGHPITAAYGGSNFHAPSASPAVSQTINKLASTTTLNVTPTVAQLGEAVTMTAAVTPADATGMVAFSRNGILIASLALTNGQASFTTTSLPAGTYQVTAAYFGSTVYQASSTTTPINLTVEGTGDFRQHFAEGATGDFFHTVIGMVNASTTTTANVTVRLLPESAPALALQFTLAPLGRRSLDLNAILSALGVVGGVSTAIESDQPVAATRQMTWGTPVYGSTLESGVPNTSQTWYFAEGSTNPQSLYFLIENPGATEAEVTFTHLLEGGAAPIVWSDVVEPFARRTFFINDVPGAGNAALSTAIASTVPIVAERAMYLNTTSRQWEGGAATAGVTAPSTTWSLAEGATGFFYTYLLLGNPNTDDASATVRYQLPSGQTIEKTYAVPGRSRRTIDIRGEDPELESATIGMTITSTVPIVAERAMWWGLPFYEGSVAFGSTATGSVWAIGEGVEGGDDAEATFVLVSNGSSTAGTVRLTVVYDDGTTEQKEYELAGTARLTVRVGDHFAAAQNRTFSVLVESVTADMPITVEYSRYQSAGGGFLGGGGAALATRVQ